MPQKRWAAAMIAMVTAVIGLATVQSHAPWYFAYNGTPSLPTGFYLAERNPARVAPGDIVCLAGSDATNPGWIADREYVPGSMPLCKQALLVGSGQIIRDGQALRLCRTAAECQSSELRTHDSQGRVMYSPFEAGTTAVPPAMLYLYSSHPRGLDSRYRGLMQADQVRSRLTPLWTW